MPHFSKELYDLRTEAMRRAQPFFAMADAIAEENTARILAVFRKHQVTDFHFRSTTGYGYDDAGRDKLDRIWADVCGAEKALFRIQFVSGTHALATVLFGLLRPGDELVSVTGSPYDTMRTVIGYPQVTPGSLRELGIDYREVPMGESGPDLNAIAAAIRPKTKMVLIQRSRGYSLRTPLNIDDISKICDCVKSLKKDCICFVDNCYGEFVEKAEPTAVGADIMAGSLIKNPGGGFAPSGGYIAGKADLVELAAFRLTAPGIGSELGASLVDNRLLYQGLFMAPHIVAQAVKGAIFAAAFFSLLNYKTRPLPEERRSDIIQAIELGSPEKMIAFCRGLQKYSPVNAHFQPEPSVIPGYSDAVIMAAGTFVQGASIELSADGPIRPPYAIYLQGGLTFEHAVLGVMGAAAEITGMKK
ncbi:aminotransferase class I/II-fold pyridoxal phosphate-dependent enzyme [Sporolituus thermophilus]|uniref:Cystathionine beta-lyase family protein involved in aluminum resistance n=1 Tax=Sporolituus thermophilus DSM 23256 TaxID=1123285 RepID=A0A1G7M5J8_9FIRM|nr:methionine gamma-lyase family protein [Sporolituus thermophilus]SDF56944.1 Cystathionine beta-lyase family protein involved in aluminum resistance [Sporolituus thermophilus DSM 23256]